MRQSLCRRTNGKLLKGIKIFVKPARYSIEETTRRGATDIERSNRVQTSRFWRPAVRDDRSFRDVLTREQPTPNSNNEAIIMSINETTNREMHIPLEPCPVMSERLKRSLIVTTDEPEESMCLQRRMIDQGMIIEDITELGRDQFIVTFQSLNLKMEAQQKLNNNDTPGLKEVKEWDNSVRRVARVTWIEIRGIPIHLWNRSNICKVAESWGDVITVLGEKEHQTPFRALLLIETQNQGTIEGRFIICTRKERFDVFVREVEKTEIKIDNANLEDNQSTEEDVGAEKENSTRIEESERVPETDVSDQASKGDTHSQGSSNNAAFMTHRMELESRTRTDVVDQRCDTEVGTCNRGSGSSNLEEPASNFSPEDDPTDSFSGIGNFKWNVDA